VRRAIVLYVATVLLSIGGFEGIRRIGNTLIAPRHIAGAWRLSVPVSSSSCPLLEFKEGEPQSLHVEQSGRYLTLTFSDVQRTRLRAHFDKETLQGHNGSSLPCAAGKQIRTRGHFTGDRLEITLTRPQESPASSPPTLVLIATRESYSSQPATPSSSH
jgi:hypothetical protein